MRYQTLRAICELHAEKHSNRHCSPELHSIDWLNYFVKHTMSIDRKEIMI